MKALSVRQPWASMIASGRKTIEVRSWSTRYRGPLLICATQRPRLADLPTGAALCVVELIDCRPMTKDDERGAAVPHQPGYFAWLLRHIRSVGAFRVVGRLGLFDVDTISV